MKAAQIARVRTDVEEFVSHVFGSLPRVDQRAKGNLYLQGLMLDGKRTSMQPMRPPHSVPVGSDHLARREPSRHPRDRRPPVHHSHPPQPPTSTRGTAHRAHLSVYRRTWQSWVSNVRFWAISRTPVLERVQAGRRTRGGDQAQNLLAFADELRFRGADRLLLPNFGSGERPCPSSMFSETSPRTVWLAAEEPRALGLHFCRP